MAWTTPTNPVAGTIITVAYAITNFVNNLIHLRSLTGAADPPGSNYTIRSASTSATDWSKVSTDMLADLSVTDAKVANGVINASTKLAGGSVVLANMAANSVDTSQLLNNSVTNAKIPDGVVNAQTKLAAGSVVLGNMAANSVDSPQIVSGAIDPGHIAVSAVQTSHLADGNISLVKMGANSVGTSQLVDGAVTHVKLTTVAGLISVTATPFTLTTTNQDAAQITVVTAGTYLVLASVGFFTTSTSSNDASQTLEGTLSKSAGVFGWAFKHLLTASPVQDNQEIIQTQAQIVALAASEAVTLKVRKSGGTGGSGVNIATLNAIRIGA